MLDTEGVREALRKKFHAPEWVTMEEVGNGTGANCKRHADMILFNMYPSRGLALVGIEIKVSRSDLKHELNIPQKAEEIAQYCNEWYLAVPKGLIRDDDIIPINWGILEIESSGIVRKRKAAKWFEDKPIPKSFWAALMRKAFDVISKHKYDIWRSGFVQAEENTKNELQKAKRIICANEIRQREADVLEALDKYLGYDLWSMRDENIKKLAAVYYDMTLYNNLKNAASNFAYHIKNYIDDTKKLDKQLEDKNDHH